MNPNEHGITILNEDSPWHDQWIHVKVRHFIDRHGKRGAWSYVGRQANRQAAVIVARNASDELVLIKQFRLPLQRWVYEFPAGLVDDGEDLATAALRELQEETGHSGTVISISPALTSTAGLSTETFHLVQVRVEGEAGAHAREGAEAIEVHIIPRGAEQAFLAQAAQEPDTLIDGKLYTHLLTLITM